MPGMPPVTVALHGLGVLTQKNATVVLPVLERFALAVPVLVVLVLVYLASRAFRGRSTGESRLEQPKSN